jgi:hypothetical protein
LGVEDSALYQGQTFWTIVVDLEKSLPMDLLLERTSDTFAIWLRVSTPEQMRGIAGHLPTLPVGSLNSLRAIPGDQYRILIRDIAVMSLVSRVSLL